MSIEKPDKWEAWKHENHTVRKINPENIISRNPGSPEDELTSSFLLTVALIFNSLKGLLVIHDTMAYAYDVEGTKKEINGNVGEQQGIIMQLQSLILSSVHEALVFLRDSQEAYASPYIKDLLRNTSDSSQIIWEVLNRTAKGESIDDKSFPEYKELSKLLVQARNNVGFHFQTDRRLAEGYRKFFFGDMEGPQQTLPESNQWAYWSLLVSDYDKSRYYYADAALQGYFVNLFGGEEGASQRLKEVLGLLGLVLRAFNELLEEHHKIIS